MTKDKLIEHKEKELKIYPFAEERENGKVAIGFELGTEIVSPEGKAFDLGVHEFIRDEMVYLASSYASKFLNYALEIWNGEVEPPDLEPLSNGKTR